MAIIFNKSLVNITMPIVECPDHLIINGHLYDKYSLTPIPLKFFNQGFDCNLSIFKRINQWMPGWGNTRQNNCMQVDNYDPNIFYVTTQAEGWALLKINANGDTLSRTSNMGFTNFSYETTGYRMEIVDQDTTYLYILKHPGDTGSTSYYIPHMQLFKVNKNNFADCNRVDFFNYSNRAAFLYADAQYIYLMGNGSIYTYNIIFRYRKFDGSVTEIGRVNDLTSFTCLPSEIINSGAEFFEFYVPRMDATTLQMYFTLIHVDTSTATMSTTDIVTKREVSGFEQPVLNIAPYDDAVWIHEVKYFMDNGKRYLVLIKYMSNGNDPNRNGQTYFRVFRFGVDGSLILIQEKLSSATINGFLEFNDNKTLIFNNRYWIKSYQWNTVTENFEFVYEIDNDIRMVAADESDNLWIQYASTKVEVLSKFAPMKISADFELEKYDYQGIPIDSFITYKTQNFEGNYVQTIIELTLDGPCKFAENDKKTIVKTTSKDGPLPTPVVIEGDGVLRVGIRLLQG